MKIIIVVRKIFDRHKLPGQSIGGVGEREIPNNTNLLL